MSKRFIDTELWDKAKFNSSTPKIKLLTIFISCKCDLIGVFKMAPMLVNAYIGEPVTEEEILSIPMDICRLGEGVYWLEKFCNFQYGELSEASRPHKKYIKMLKDVNLLDRVSDRLFDRVSNTLKEKEEDKDKEEDKEKEKDVLEISIDPEKIKNTGTDYHSYLDMFMAIKPYNMARDRTEIISLFREASQNFCPKQILQATMDYRLYCKHSKRSSMDYRKSAKTFLSNNQYRIDWLLQVENENRGENPEEVMKAFLQRMQHNYEWSE